MVVIEEVRRQLAGLKNLGPGLVGVFVGGTNGIGEHTAREFVRYTASPRVYLVGRNQEQASKLTTEFQELNKEAKIDFIQSDVSLLRNVDKVCDEIKSKEDKINFLVLSAGIMTTKGRDETTEGLDKKFSLHYYSRLRFTQSLLPLLAKAGSNEPKRPASVISVLGSGLEGALNMNDLSLKTSYGMSACATHAITMNTLSLQHLAIQNPQVRFIHTQPGGVSGTEIGRGLPRLVSAGLYALMYTVGRPWMMAAAECGERHTWAGLAAKFQEGGVVTIGPRGENNSNPKITQKLKEEGVDEKVWKHTQDIFEEVSASNVK